VKTAGSSESVKALAARLAFLVPAALIGCSSVPADRGFEDVERAVEARIGRRASWTRTREADEQARREVERLLADELTSEAAVRIALLNDRDLQAAYEEIAIASADRVEAGLLRNPVLDVEARAPEGGGAVGFELELVQDLVSLLFRGAREQVAQAGFEAVQARTAVAVLDVAASALSAFYSVQGATQLRDLRRSVVQATEASHELARRMHEAGNLRDLDLANERALHEQAKLDLVESELELAEERERLNERMGLWGSQTAWTISARLPEPPLDWPPLEGIESEAIERSLELAAIRHEIDATARRLGFVKGTAPVPMLEVGVAAEREAGEGLWSLGPAASLSLPLFDHGQASVARAEAILRQIQERYAAEAVEIRAEVRAASSRVLALAARAEHLRREMLPLRQQILEHTQEQYNAMQVGPFQLLQAKRDQIETGADYVETLRDYWLSRTELEQLVNGGSGRIDRPRPRLRATKPSSPRQNLGSDGEAR
jgi:outer membrane protein, heavy metal efflux system